MEEVTSGKANNVPAVCMGVIPAAAAASSLAAAVWLALSILIFAASVRLLSPVIRKATGDRMAAFLLSFTLAVLSSLVLSILGVVDPSPAMALGVYLPLMSVGGFLAMEASSLKQSNQEGPQISALASAALILLCGMLRESFALSRISLPLETASLSFALPGALSFSPMENPMGILLILGYIAALSQWIESKRGGRDA